MDNLEGRFAGIEVSQQNTMIKGSPILPDKTKTSWAEMSSEKDPMPVSAKITYSTVSDFPATLFD